MMISLNQKIFLAKKIIIENYEANNGKVFISFSGGKDSTVLRHIALEIYPDIDIVFSDTTNELSEIYKFVKSINNVIWVHPRMTFPQVITKYGFPLISKEVSQKVSELKHTKSKKLKAIRKHGYQNHKDSFTDGLKPKRGSGKLPIKWRFIVKEKFDVTHKCCKILKKDPLEKWAKSHNKKAIIGLMEGESRLRKQLSLYGSESGDKIYPFLRTGWTDQDIWNYAKQNNIRFAECYYDKYVNGELVKAKTRSGCEYCGFGIHLEENSRFIRSAILSPKRYKKMMKMENNGVTFETAIKAVMSKGKNSDKP